MLRRVTISYGLEMYKEYTGEGACVRSSQRATITNMSRDGSYNIDFPSGRTSTQILESTGREEDYVELCRMKMLFTMSVSDIDLSELDPLISCPHQPIM